jgi:immune inhibitor A
VLKTPSCSESNISGNNYGCGYNATSNSWIQEHIDLSSYAGKKVHLRFEYITDAAVNGEGLLLDDLSIPAIHYVTDLEKDDGGWQPNGFVRIQNRLPQTYRVSLIKEGSKTSVDYISLDANETARIPLNFGKDLNDVILVVSGSTRFTRQEAAYQFEVK